MDTVPPALPRSERRHELLCYLATFVLALGLVVLILRLWRADLAVPFAYEHDSLPILSWTKGLIDNGWWLTNPYQGAPGRAEMYDYPTNCNLHFLLLRGLCLITSSPATVVNLYFILSFALIALSALTALRSVGVSRSVALVGSLLYAFLPYHFWRGEPHLFLGAYYMIPLMLLVILWIARGEAFLLVRHPETGRLRLDITSAKAVSSVLISAAIGCDFPYYPIFALLFLLVAGLHTYVRTRCVCTLGQTVLLAGVIGVSFVGNMSPSFLYWWQHGRNPSPDLTARRAWTDAEQLSLTVTQLLLPAENHRLPLFHRLRDKFYGGTRLVSEGDAMALGAVGSLGFLLLMGGFVCGYPGRTARSQLYHLLGVLAVCALLICTAGGFGTAVSLLGFNILRCYNRMSIFIAFLAFLAVCLALDFVYRRYAGERRGFVIGNLCLGVLLLLGLADQTGRTYLSPFATIKDSYQSDADFVARVEAAVPANTMVFQLPYVGFLAYTNLSHNMLPYSHFRGYLHSHQLRWSFGAMHGRAEDSLHAHVANLPLDESLRALAFLGFGGIYVDRFGYADGARDLEGKLRTLLGSEPVVSRNGRLSFFDMASFNRRLRQGYTDEEWQRQHELAVNPAQVEWTSGFFAEETNGCDRWHWCAKSGALKILNHADRPKQVTVRFLARTCRAGAATLTIDGAIAERLAINEAGTLLTRTLAVPPGELVFRFDCDAQPFIDPSRTIVFGLYNFQLQETAAPEPVHVAQQSN